MLPYGHRAADVKLAHDAASALCIHRKLFPCLKKSTQLVTCFHTFNSQCVSFVDCLYLGSKTAAVKKTWAALNYLWYLWAISSCLLWMLNTNFPKAFWQLFSGNFWIRLSLVPRYCGTSQSCDMQLTAQPSCRACSPRGEKAGRTVCLSAITPPLVSSTALFVTSLKVPQHPLKSLLVFLWKSENNVALSFTRQKMNAWFSLVCSISPLTASCWVGTDRSSGFSPLNLFWY